MQELTDKLDAKAVELGLSRSALVKMILTKYANKEQGNA